MPKDTISQKVIVTYLGFLAFCSILMLSGMFLSPSESGNSIFLGLSLSRLMIAFGFVIAFVFFAALSWKAIKNKGWAERFLERWFGGEVPGKALSWLAGLSF